ncbi:MAG: hypothetical protein RJA57_1277 [Bacteroidota bacterium]|jgi:hypothetical protein
MKRILILFLVAVSFSGLSAQTADEVVGKHLDAIGGADNWRKVNSVKMEGVLQVQGTDVNVTMTRLHGKGQRQDISVMGMTGFDITTPTEGWTFMPFQGQQTPEAKTPEAVAESQEELDVQGKLVDYGTKGHTIELLGKEEVDGTDCFKLKITSKAGIPETLLIDSKTFLVVKSIAIRKANGQEMEIPTLYSNYQKQPEGILIPLSMTLGFGELNITKVIINGPVDEAVFKK